MAPDDARSGGGGAIDALYEEVRRALPPTEGEPPAELRQVAPGIRVLALRTPTLPPAAHTNTYVVGPDRGPQMVVDPGSPYPDQQARLDTVLAMEASAGRPIALVALTHHHGDHVGGAAALAARWSVPVAAHARTRQRLAGRVDVARELASGEVLDDFEVTCVFTPGHADGHLCFERGGASIVGDMVAGVGTILIDPSEGDMTEYLASLALLLDRSSARASAGATTLLPAHGPSIHDGQGKLREYIAHRTMREERVLGALSQQPRTARELVAVAYSDTPKPLWMLAERSLLAHLGKLVQEARAEEVEPGRWTRL